MKMGKFPGRTAGKDRFPPYGASPRLSTGKHSVNGVYRSLIRAPQLPSG